MPRRVTIATLQMGYGTNVLKGHSHPSNIPFGATLENNLAILEAKIEEAGRALAADFVCFSEIALSLGLSAAADDERKRSVVRIPGPEVERLAAAARKADCYVIVGLYEKGEPLGYNSAALLGPDGALV
ncbi:MAG: carbon-nitrogen hydrolase family protein, partial [Planctomycetes bacterium]|nr:carbon-nitrogen hydrolase family protein [Planctomycetota bacterium]